MLVIYRRKNRGQTIVIGALLLVGLAIGFLIYLQISLFPDINQNRELRSQSDSVNSMIDLRSEIQSYAALPDSYDSTSETVYFNNYVDYPLQPASPSDQIGQISTISGELKIEDASDPTGSSFDETDDGYYDNIVSTIIYNPRYIEGSSSERDIVMDNTVITEYTPDQPINHAQQSIIAGNQITIPAVKTRDVDGIKSPNNIEISIDRKETIDAKINGDIELVMNTNKESINNTMWEKQENIDKAELNSGSIELELSDTTYDLRIVRMELSF